MLVCLWQAPGVLHHVMGRGIEKKNIFVNNKDRNDFINRLAQLVEESKRGRWFGMNL